MVPAVLGIRFGVAQNHGEVANLSVCKATIREEQMEACNIWTFEKTYKTYMEVYGDDKHTFRLSRQDLPGMMKSLISSHNPRF